MNFDSAGLSLYVKLDEHGVIILSLSREKAIVAP
jgi:hypothetical protein